MGKKEKKAAGGQGDENSRGPVITRRGWKIIAGGAGVAVLGYLVLALTDPAGRNWASQVSPFLILGGYAAVGYGILARESA